MPEKFHSADKLIKKLQEKQGELFEKVRLAQDSLLIEMRDWIKDNHVILGGWNNLSYNLEKSISFLESVIEGGTILGALTAGEDYAPDVEFKENHWVLSGAINEFRGKMLSLIAERVREQ